MKMEKDPDSMATVQIKQEYAASEVYSTTSEPPPAYKRRSNSVQIARIAAITIIASSFIIGSFILAAAYLQARASCDQVQALDSVLEKEILLESLQQVNKDVPQAEPLIGQNSDVTKNTYEQENVVDDTSKEEPQSLSAEESDQGGDSSFSENEEGDDLQKHMKVPLEFDLSDLAASLLENNQKSRMNCVVERKRSEEIVGSPLAAFGKSVSKDQKRKKMSGERISIFCESGAENKKEDENSSKIRPLLLQRIAIPFGPEPKEFPLTHMPQNMPRGPWLPQIQQEALRPSVSVNMLPFRQPDAEMRIQVQRVPLRESFEQHESSDIPIPFLSNDVSQIHVQHVPLGEALQRVGITSDDLRNIQRMAEERINEEIRSISGDSVAAIENESSSEENSSQQSGIAGFPQKPAQNLNPPLPQVQILHADRSAYGRSLPMPIRIPVPMMQTNELHPQFMESDRPHFVQPRSIRSINNVLHREKRVKRCACDCNC